MSTPSHPAASARAGALMCVTSMCSAQLGLAASVTVLDRMSPIGASWLRLAWAAIAMILIARPWRIRYSRAALRAGLVLGIATAGMSGLFMVAASRLPLGTASALEFLGPFGVAAAHGRRGTWRWPVIAACGVVLLTQPWHGGLDLLGIVCALAAAGCYAGYILLTQRVGDEVAGIAGLGISMPVAAVASTAILLASSPSTLTHLSPQLIVIGIGLATLVPLIPFVLELLALRRITAGAFGTLMCLEPAIALLLGLVVLGQRLDLPATFGIAGIIAAGLGAVRSGQRMPAAGQPEPTFASTELI